MPCNLGASRHVQDAPTSLEINCLGHNVEDGSGLGIIASVPGNLLPRLVYGTIGLSHRASG
jgi:hypothetical protein